MPSTALNFKSKAASENGRYEKKINCSMKKHQITFETEKSLAKATSHSKSDQWENIDFTGDIYQYSATNYNMVN